MCGLWSPRIEILHRRRGSSPRVRAVVQGFIDSFRTRRFIPACAGCGWYGRSGATTGTVHPRVCGLWCTLTKRVLTYAGSSPRVRAVVILTVFVVLEPRFIPACAGCGLTVMLFSVFPAVHPRVCGLWKLQNRRLQQTDGSSPRVRAVACL